MAANVNPAAKKKPAAKKTSAVKKKPAAKKKPVARKKPAAKRKSATKKPVAKKTTAGKAAPSSKSAASGKSNAGYSDKSAWAKKKPGVKAADQPKSIENGQLVDTHVVYEIMDYMVTWPDRYHHPREDLIYGRVAEIDARAADEVDTLQRDHDRAAVRGREVLKAIERWREGEGSGAAVAKSGRLYIDHMYEHMNVEEKVVFPHIESVLSLQDWR